MKLFSNKTRQFAAKFSLFTLIFGIVYSVEFSRPKRAEAAVDVSGLGSAIVGCSHIGEALVDMVSELGKKELSGIKSEKSTNSESDSSTITAIVVTDFNVAEETEKERRISQQQQDKINCKDAMGRAAANIALTNITQQTVNWANTGLSGNPLYVVDSKSYFAGVKEKALNSFLNDLSSSNNAFAQQITKELIQNQQAKNDRKLRELRTDQKQKTGFTSAEFEEDFNNGGWSGFLNYNLNSANNPLGSRFAVQQELSAQQADEVNAQKDELIWNNGFLSIKKCADPNNKGDNCKAFETQTPGIIIQNQLSKALNVPVDRLVNVQYYNDALGGLLDGLMNNLFNQGLAQIFKGQQQQLGTSNNNFLYGDNYGGSNISTLGSNTFNADNLFTYTTSWFGINGDFDIRNMKQFDAVIQTQKDYNEAMAVSLPMLDKIITPMTELDVCIPGPNPVWQSETAENINIFLDSVAVAYQNGGLTPILTGKQLKGLSVTGGVLITVGGVLQVIPGVGTVVGAVVAGVGLILKIVQGVASDDSAKKAAAINAQNTANIQAITAESESNQRRLAWGMSLAYADYSARVAKAYDKNHLLPIADTANPIVANLRNYDNNITDLKDLYYQRKQETLLNISRLNQLQSNIRPIVNAARQRAFAWNRINCPIAETTDSGGGGVDSGPGNGTDSGGGGVDSGPGNGTGTGTGGGADGGGDGTGAGSGGGAGTGVGTGGTGVGTGTGGN